MFSGLNFPIFKCFFVFFYMCSQARHVYTNHCMSSPEPPVSDNIYVQYYLHVIRKRLFCSSVMHKVSTPHGLDVTVENLSDDSCSYSAGICKTTLIDTTGLFFLVFFFVSHV